MQQAGLPLIEGSSVRLLSMAASPARLSACSLPWTPALPVLKIRESFKAAVCNERDLIKIERFFLLIFCRALMESVTMIVLA